MTSAKDEDKKTEFAATMMNYVTMTKLILVRHMPTLEFLHNNYVIAIS